jgi:hypothetical protein
MRTHAWLMLGGLALACGGSAFTATPENGNGGSSNDENSNAGVLNRAGRGSGGKKSTAGDGAGGSDTSSGGTDAIGGTETTSGGSDTGGTGTTLGGMPAMAGNWGIAGDLVSGGVTSSAGSAGTMPGPDTACPDTQPTKGGACQGKLSCSYGADVRTQCRAHASCDSGDWAITDPGCTKLHSCGGTVANAACEMGTAACVKDGYQYCVCSACQGNLCGMTATWQCHGGPSAAGCPKLQPNEGQPCSGELKCRYGACGVAQDTPLDAVCNADGTWHYESVICIQ